ncbi:protoporphyrinogen oxidase [Phycicoccus sp.]|uniref:protoporphyrinogen oxidase n=1 Tax=Phycicoccus sp. TaxID=1902410 RepID=UPI002C20B159|nr:protoporphyrinogen oxidase [Phycicoccus sp.]HMM95213.1 protoporphyrinogen oxidase [Phycicoccus sp.]
MGKLSFLAGLAAGYVLGAKAGTQRYEQIRRTSSKVWNSDPVQKQVAQAKDAARTKAAPVVADLVADAARATGEKLRQGRTIASEAIHHDGHGSSGSGGATTNGSGTASGSAEHADAWAAATRPPGPTD